MTSNFAFYRPGKIILIEEYYSLIINFRIVTQEIYLLSIKNFFKEINLFPFYFLSAIPLNNKKYFSILKIVFLTNYYFKGERYA
jgi:hypothetical protein